uniref:NUMOD4 domain-containing protein n=1 Tax=Moumouvirus sp. 'Monve' TaxID=1128131 RepID=H2EFU4_9VIRU|nr:hypothetical protein mv_R794 [Moumouvirus Monve]
MTVKEIWKSIPIKEIKKDYDISNLGRVRRTKDNKLISLVNRSGYDSILYNVYENKKNI